MASPLEIKRCTDSFCAEVVGAQLGDILDPQNVAAWHEALEEHQLLVFRDLDSNPNGDLDANPEAQVEIAKTLGDPLIENDSGLAYQFVSNTREGGILGDERFAFHSDHAFMDDPIEIISLYGLDVPQEGTQTRFLNCALAAEALPESLREPAETYHARHIIDPAAATDLIPVRRPRLSDDLPHAYHPILMREARTSRPVLYVSEQQTDIVRELDDREGRDLIEALFAHLYDDRFIYVHEWRAGDLVLWDNRALQHAREAIPAGVSRTLRRVSVGGTPVHEYFRRDAKWGLDPMPPNPAGA